MINKYNNNQTSCSIVMANFVYNMSGLDKLLLILAPVFSVMTKACICFEIMLYFNYVVLHVSCFKTISFLVSISISEQ